MKKTDTKSETDPRNIELWLETKPNVTKTLATVLIWAYQENDAITTIDHVRKADVFKYRGVGDKAWEKFEMLRGYPDPEIIPERKILQFDHLKQFEMEAVNRCMADLYEYYNTCATPENWKNFRIFQELITTKNR
ncbi:hypothetical protein LCGC14_2081240 [marine sediment metagenome]|uniref:Uncharacterized protein n=1 Tax=marine sediment metagenome TaxID=412755 RepID=A0A0F9HCJ1_9ZZZZ